jgi:rare lipoprotein A
MHPRSTGAFRGACAPVHVSLWLLVAGCSLPPLSIWHTAPKVAGPSGEIGTASWYGPGFHGNRTSSGEVYDQSELTAAHPTLPLGTRVMVTNLGNGKSVEVRINDRGPFLKGRVIDLSRAAARALDLVGPGTARVRIEPLLEDGESPAVVTYAVQTGAFQDGSRAIALKESLASRYDDVYMSPLRTASSLYYRVRIGPYDRRDRALAEARRLTRGGLPSLVVEELRQ